jgi:hypothetical protein
VIDPRLNSHYKRAKAKTVDAVARRTSMGTSDNVAERNADFAPRSQERPIESDPRPASGHSGLRMAPSIGARIQAALAASARTEATLGDLSRTVKFLMATIGSVRDANAGLASELATLAEVLKGGDGDRAASAGGVEMLARFGDDGERDAEHDRLVSEHDRFIAMLVEDHERDLDALRRRLAELERTLAPKKI